jgi:predicted ATPase
MALVTVLVSAGGSTVEEMQFGSAVDAVATAVSLHRRGQQRTGIDVAEGLDAATAGARALCDDAQEGEILVSEVVRGLIANRRGFEFVTTTRGAAVVWQEPHEASRMPLALAGVVTSPLIGRAEELDHLARTWKEVVAGERRAVFVGGTAGIGKTRLAAEAARVAAVDDGAVVLYGRCEEDLGVPYQPFVEALHAFLRDLDSDTLHAYAGEHLAHLDRFVPAVARVDDVPRQRSEPTAERYLMFEAVAGVVDRVSVERPVLFVIDDLHWATKPTTLMLSHLVRRGAPSRVFVVGTYRDDELGRFNPLIDVLADLRRTSMVERIALRGLDRAAVAEFIAAAAGHALDARGLTLASLLYDETDGNPFYIGEVLNHLVESGVIYQQDDRWTADPGVDIRVVGIPESVSDVVGRRVGRLSPAAVRALTVAALVGATFDFNVLAAVPDAADSVDELLDSLDEAENAGLLASGDATGYAFAHSLVRQTLLAGLTSARRVRLHRRIGEAIETLPDAGERVDALAYHFSEAVGGSDIAKAASYAIQAAERALEQLAHEEALARVDRGLHALELDHRPDPAQEADLWLLRARALQDGPREDAPAVVEALERAAANARECGSAERLARAAELMAEETVFGSGSAPAVRLCDDALEQAGDRVDLRARVLGALVYARATMESSSPELAELAGSAAELAYQVGDPTSLCRALVARGVVLLAGPDVDELHAVGERLEAVSADLPEAWISSWAHRFVGQACLQRGNRDGFDVAHRALTTIGQERRHTTAAGWAAAWDGMVAMLDGALDDVEEHTAAILDRGGSHPNYTNAFTAQLFYLRRAQGRLGEIVGVLEDTVAANPLILGFRVALATTYADLGDADGARRHFEVAAGDDFARVPRDLAWSGALALLSDAAFALRDADRAVLLQELLTPYAGQLIVAATGVACPGAADRYLSQLSQVLGHDDTAREELARAVALEASVRQPPR